MAFKLGLIVVSLLMVWTVSASSQDDTFLKGLQNFSSKFYQTAAKKNTGSIVISPYSAQTAFLLLLMSAKDKTADEIKQVFGLSALSRSDIEAAYTKYHSSFAGNNFIKVANKIYASNRYTLKPSFVEIATKSFGSEARTIDFVKSQEAADEINSWVKNETNGKIDNLVQSNDLNSVTSVFLANAIYFRGEWKIPFKPEDTESFPFWINKDESVNVPMMSLKKYKYGVFEYFVVFEVDFKDSDLSMMIMLPGHRHMLANLENNLTNIDIFSFNKDMREITRPIFLPKFKIETETDLKDIFNLMGVERMFSDKAEFNDLFDASGGVTVNKAVQKSFIEVDEYGAVAAAVTGFIGTSRMAPRLIDHPFIYVIKNSQAVFFMGSVKKF